MLKYLVAFSFIVCSLAYSHCQPDCACGCAEGKECHCEHGCPPKKHIFHNGCKADCYCGCADGKECHCQNGCNVDRAEVNKCHNGCQADCNCGCAEGNECDCTSPTADPEGYNYQSPVPVPLRNEDARIALRAGLRGVWLPEDPILMKPFVADPRAIQYSAGWRFDDKVIDRNVIDVSYGDTLAIYRWLDIGPWCGDLQLDLEGALWACFEPLKESAPLVNADYYVGIPITYAFDRWQIRLRGFHISSHIGDEYLLNHRHFHRKNPSAEYLDFFISHDLTDEIRVYGGLGYILADDESFPEKRFYQALGAEVHAHTLGFNWYAQQLYGQPFMGIHLRGNGRFKRHVDLTYVAGYEFGKTTGMQRMVRIYAEYHDGYSVEGQFSRFPTHYYALRAAYSW